MMQEYRHTENNTPIEHELEYCYTDCRRQCGALCQGVRTRNPERTGMICGSGLEPWRAPVRALAVLLQECKKRFALGGEAVRGQEGK